MKSASSIPNQQRAPSQRLAQALNLLFTSELPSDWASGCTLLGEILLEKNVPNEIRWHAQTVLGSSYRRGRGVDRSDEMALKLQVEAADQGYSVAALEVAMHFDSRNTPGQMRLDPERAAHYYAIAADQGILEAQTNLGVLHLFGVVKNADPRLGQKWLEKSRLQGDTEAMVIISTYETLMGPLPDLAEENEPGTRTTRYLESELEQALAAVFSDWPEGNVDLPVNALDMGDMIKRITPAMSAYPSGITAFTAEAVRRRRLAQICVVNSQVGPSQGQFKKFVVLLSTHEGRQTLESALKESQS